MQVQLVEQLMEDVMETGEVHKDEPLDVGNARYPRADWDRLAADTRPELRIRACWQLASRGDLGQRKVERLLLRLVADHEPPVRVAARGAFRKLFQEASSVVQSAVTGEWAVSEVEPVREALARALIEPTAHPGVPSAIEVLMRDPGVRVRVSAAHAARSRVALAPGRYLGALRHLARDESEAVRRAALSGLDDAAARGLAPPMP